MHVDYEQNKSAALLPAVSMLDTRGKLSMACLRTACVDGDGEVYTLASDL